MQYKTKAIIQRRNPDRVEEIEEDFSTPDEFDNFHKNLGELDEKKYLTLANEALRMRKQYPEYQKGIAYSMCGWGLDLVNKNERFEFLQSIAYEFGNLELPDEVCSGSWEEVEKLIHEAAEKINSSEIHK